MYRDKMPLREKLFWTLIWAVLLGTLASENLQAVLVLIGGFAAAFVVIFGGIIVLPNILDRLQPGLNLRKNKPFWFFGIGIVAVLLGGIAFNHTYHDPTLSSEVDRWFFGIWFFCSAVIMVSVLCLGVFYLALGHEKESAQRDRKAIIDQARDQTTIQDPLLRKAYHDILGRL